MPKRRLKTRRSHVDAEQKLAQRIYLHCPTKKVVDYTRNARIVRTVGTAQTPHLGTRGLENKMTAYHLPVINVIPSDYNGNPQAALGYAWQDLENKTPGSDVIAIKDPETGIDYKAAVKAKMAEMGITKAAYNCMWCGGVWDVMELSEQEPTPEKTEASGEELTETAAIVAALEKIEIEEQEARSKHHAGYCIKCHTYCYGDCDA